MAFPDGIVDAIDPARLRLLVEVGRQGSISAAADACRMGQPSATKHLKTLEAAVGAKLIERNGRSSRLTEAGEVVAGHGLRVLDTIEAMREDLRSLNGAERGTLTLGASTTPGSYVLPSLLQCFADRHPRVDVDVVIGSSAWVADRVARREVSLGLAGEVDLPEGVFAEPFLDDYHPAKRWELDSNEAIKRSVRAGLGIGFVSKLVVEEELDRGDLVSFQLEDAEPMRRSVYLLRPDGRDPTPSERAFIETLCSCCAVSVAGCSVTAA
jgi:molybdate transport repressor ModE-like protein